VTNTLAATALALLAVAVWRLFLVKHKSLVAFLRELAAFGLLGGLLVLLAGCGGPPVIVVNGTVTPLTPVAQSTPEAGETQVVEATTEAAPANECVVTGGVMSYGCVEATIQAAQFPTAEPAPTLPIGVANPNYTPQPVYEPGTFVRAPQP
jgi:hypothetical protein